MSKIICIFFIKYSRKLRFYLGTTDKIRSSDSRAYFLGLKLQKQKNKKLPTAQVRHDITSVLRAYYESTLV